MFNVEELRVRTELNFTRLRDDAYYQIGEVFAPIGYEWYGDKEGRALLAFVSHYKMSGRKIPCMDEMMSVMRERTNEHLFFGPLAGEIIHEQQLSGHSWLLRGLCEYREQFGDDLSLEMIESICENLYYPTKGKYKTYPIDRSEPKAEGGVSGKSVRVINGWKLSSDIGCAFMSIDGLSHAYIVTGDERIKALVDEMIRVYLGIDKVALRAQTHCTLTAARGMIRMYYKTNEVSYLDGARTIMELYANGGGMSETYQNLNWWGRPDTWTEPCAIVDSMMLAGELYKITKEEQYRALAARIYHNGLATAQRENGGAGTDTVVVEGVEEILRSKMFEAYFCCTMRLSEGLRYVDENKELFAARKDGGVSKKGRIYADGDILYAEVSGGAEKYADHFVELDGHRLCPIVKYYKVPRDIMDASEQRILF